MQNKINLDNMIEIEFKKIMDTQKQIKKYKLFIDKLKYVNLTIDKNQKEDKIYYKNFIKKCKTEQKQIEKEEQKIKRKYEKLKEQKEIQEYYKQPFNFISCF